MNLLLRRFLLLIVTALFAATLARAEDLAAVKARIEQRVPKLVQHEANGSLGENNLGFVDVRGGGGDAASVASAENHDREIVYAAIAKQQGVSADAVGRARAKKIAASSPAGTWIQHEDGSWHKK